MKYRHWMLIACVGTLSACANMQPATGPDEATAGPAAPAEVPSAASAPVAAQSAPAASPPAGAPAQVQVQGQQDEGSDAAVIAQISTKLRAHLRLPKGVFPKTAEVVIEAVLAPNGNVLLPRVAHSSGYKSLDNAVLRALQKSQPLPVPRSVKSSDASQPIRLVFRPLQPK